MIKRFLLIVLALVLVVFMSALTSYLVTRSQANIRFVSEPRLDNESYGYFQINGKNYYQLYTTTQDNIGNGLHIHRIDLRGGK